MTQSDTTKTFANTDAETSAASPSRDEGPTIRPDGPSAAASDPAEATGNAGEAISGTAASDGLPPISEKKAAGKASAARATKAQEDRLAAALRANLARRKAASRAARQSGRAADSDEAGE